jgi:hypothetical protein
MPHVIALGGDPREQKMLKGHLPRVIYHRVYSNMRRVAGATPWRVPSTGHRAIPSQQAYGIAYGRP